MADVEKGYVTLTYAEENGSDRAAFLFNLPSYVQKDEIGVNLRRVDRALQIGGVREILFHGITGMGVSEEKPEIVGMNAKGEALAGKTSSRKIVPDHAGNATSGPSVLPHSMRSTYAHIDINLDQSSVRIAGGDVSEGIRSSKEWAKELDLGTKSTADMLGQIQLIQAMYPREIALPLLLDANAILGASYASPVDALAGTFHPQSPDLVMASLNIIAINAFLNAAQLFIWRHYRKEFRPRLSLFNGPEFDRAILLKAYTKTRNFVKQINSIS
jgi:hypothetical protein